MPTLLEYFNNDFKDLSIDRTINFTIQALDESKNVIGEENVEVKERIRQNIDSSVRLFTYYVPSNSNTIGIIGSLIDQLESNAKEIEGIISIGTFIGDVEVGQHNGLYSNRLYFYIESSLNSEEIVKLDHYSKTRGLFITLRSLEYVNRKMEIEKPIAFISHDSRDKELIAKRLANGLNSRLCFVWYDEYSLRVGESLRESIEEGIKSARKCILVLTKNFLNNPGWGKKEFNSIFTREMIYNERVVLPIWYGVTKQDVFEYSPSLADTFALTWPSPDNKTEEEYNRDVEQLISKIHTAVTKVPYT
jgi:hypothetical protein